MESIKDILNDRGDRYGDFEEQAKISQALKNMTIPRQPMIEWRPYQREAMEMIIHKISRIVNGDPGYVDSWRDIEGYAKLVADRLEQK